MRFRSKLTFAALYFLSIHSVYGQFWGFMDPVRLSDKINSNAEETTPVLNRNGNSVDLYFVRTFDDRNVGGNNDQDIWVSVENENGWSSAKNVRKLNNENHNALGGISNNQAFVLYSDKKQTFPAIKLSNISDEKLPPHEKWTTPSLVNFETGSLDLSNQEMGFFISKDKKMMVLSLKLADSYGMEDLYILNLETAELYHLPKEINSSGYEISPFLTDGGDTLFFASNGLGGFGGCDIFYTILNKKTNEWSKPINLGNKINSEGFDAYLIKDSYDFYWSSNRGKDDADIFKSTVLFPPKLEIVLSKTNISLFQGNDGKVDLTVKSGVAPYIFEWSNGMKTEDIAQLKKGTYEVIVTDSIGQKVNAKVSLVEPEPETKKVIRLPEVRYALNSWEFVNDETINSFDSLNLVAQLLNEYPTMRLELMSHTDARGNEKANLLLSQNRAKAVFTYLVREKGIDGRRLIPVGKGETEPAKYMDIKSGKEILLTETYINWFKISNPKEFERLHQINRRMEGKILGLDFDTSSSLLVNPAYFIKIK
jgi:outer membrane protein OmpA-like peptidoglycan-associated protein